MFVSELKMRSMCNWVFVLRGGLGSPGLEKPNPQPSHLAWVQAILTYFENLFGWVSSSRLSWARLG